MSRLPRTTQMLTIPETAERLSIHKQAVYRHIWSGALKATNVGTGTRPRLRVADHEAERFMKAREMKAVA